MFTEGLLRVGHRDMVVSKMGLALPCGTHTLSRTQKGMSQGHVPFFFFFLQLLDGKLRSMEGKGSYDERAGIQRS